MITLWVDFVDDDDDDSIDNDDDWYRELVMEKHY